MAETRRRHPDDDDPIEIANDMLRHRANRTMSPSSDAMEGSPGRPDTTTPDGQLGPDEISEPEEVIRNNEAKLHH